MAPNTPKQQAPLPLFLTVSAFAAMAGLKRTTIDRLIRCGSLPVYQDGKRHVLCARDLARVPKLLEREVYGCKLQEEKND